MNNNKQNVLQNPLRYPGSKISLCPIVSRFLAHNNFVSPEIIELYAGGASLSLNLVYSGICERATIIERDPMLYSFWKMVFSETEELVERISCLDISLKRWHELKRFKSIDSPEEEDELELAVACLLYNRTNFSGILHAGPIGGQSQSSDYKIDCRFNKTEIIKRILKIAKLKGQVNVLFDDALNFLTKNNTLFANTLVYVDPPYFVEGNKLYRYYYKVNDHKKLAEILTDAEFQWLLSYDDHPFIEMLYEDFNQLKKLFRYMSRAPKKKEELLVTNLNVPKEFLDDDNGLQDYKELVSGFGYDALITPASYMCKNK